MRHCRDPVTLSYLECELATTRSVLRLAPPALFDWRPGANSWSLFELASHLVSLPHLATKLLIGEEMDLMASSTPLETPRTSMDVVPLFDSNTALFITTLSQVDDTRLNAHWTLRSGEHVIWTRPRHRVLREWCFGLLVHHRSQMITYLRQLSIPVPSNTDGYLIVRGN